MKHSNFKFLLGLLVLITLNISCSSADVAPPPADTTVGPLSPSPSTLNLDNVMVNTESVSKSFTVSVTNVSTDITVTAPTYFKVSTDNVTFASSQNIPVANFASGSLVVYVKFAPTELGFKNGNITISSGTLSEKTVAVAGTGIPRVYNYPTFTNVAAAFGTGLSQSNTQTFTLHNDNSNIQKIYAYIKLRCPSAGCNAWDVFANVKVKDPSSNEWYEIARYITPYGKNNAQVDRGFKVDVTDFKSLLSGTVELRSFVEVWGSDGWVVSVDFDFIEGTPDYPYYAISRLIQYNDNSLEGVIYGENASAFDLTKSVQIPANALATNLRTIITGWGHATPNDPDGRPCAEWCFRTHNVKINGSNTFSHYLGPIGCASNLVQPQSGNWSPDRAGWCPGMAVPIRTDNFSTSLAGQSLNYEYAFQPWVNDLASTNANIHAYYAISSFVVVKSNTPIVKPTVTE